MPSQPAKAATVVRLNPEEEVAEAQATTPENMLTPPRIDDTVVLVVGEGEMPMFVSKALLMKVPFFEQMFAARFTFRESIENKVLLPEDDPELWRKALEFLRTGKFFPYFKAGGPDDTRAFNPFSTPSLDVALVVSDWQGNLSTWDSSAHPFGVDTLSEGTYEMLEDVVLLFRLAEKYFWHDLMEVCVDKTAAFPTGMRAYSLLSKHCSELFSHLFKYRVHDEEGHRPSVLALEPWGPKKKFLLLINLLGAECELATRIVASMDVSS